MAVNTTPMNSNTRGGAAIVKWEIVVMFVLIHSSLYVLYDQLTELLFTRCRCAGLSQLSHSNLCIVQYIAQTLLQCMQAFHSLQYVQFERHVRVRSLRLHCDSHLCSK